MLFQGQEFLQGDWFQDTVPLDWDQSETFRGIVRLYRDLIRLRLNRSGVTRGLTGHGIAVHRIDEERKLVAFHRWQDGGPGDDVIVVANFMQGPAKSIAWASRGRGFGGSASTPTGAATARISTGSRVRVSKRKPVRMRRMALVCRDGRRTL